MSQHYLVELVDVVDEEDALFARVTAPDAPTAITTFLQTIAPNDPVFLDYVYGTAITFSFAEYFWIRSDEDDALFAQGLLQVSDELFTARVQEFFGAHHDYADLYLSYYFSDSPSAPAQRRFPPEMLAYIWQHRQYGSVRAIPVGEG